MTNFQLLSATCVASSSIFYFIFNTFCTKTAKLDLKTADKLDYMSLDADIFRVVRYDVRRPCGLNKTYLTPCAKQYKLRFCTFWCVKKSPYRWGTNLPLQNSENREKNFCRCKWFFHAKVHIVTKYEPFSSFYCVPHAIHDDFQAVKAHILLTVWEPIITKTGPRNWKNKLCSNIFFRSTCLGASINEFFRSQANLYKI